MSTAAGADSPPQIEYGISSRQQPRRGFKPRPELEGEYNPYSDEKPSAPLKGSTDPKINATWEKQSIEWKIAYNEKQEQKELEKKLKIKSLTDTENDRLAELRAKNKAIDEAGIKEEKRYKQGEKWHDSAERSNNAASNVGFGKPGELGTDEEDSTDKSDDRDLDGFQVLAPNNHEMVLKRKAREAYETGGGDAPAQSSMTLAEGDEFHPTDSKDSDIVDLDSNPDDLFEDVTSENIRKPLSKVNILNSENRTYNTIVRPDRITNHRQRKWLEHNGGAGLFSDIWKNAILVEVLVRPHGESAVAIYATGKDRDGNPREIRLDLHDFFTIFSIAGVKGGDSCFEAIKFDPKKPKDIKKLERFFESVTLEGNKIGSRTHSDAPHMRIKPWRPREASRKEKETLSFIEKYNNKN